MSIRDNIEPGTDCAELGAPATTNKAFIADFARSMSDTVMQLPTSTNEAQSTRHGVFSEELADIYSSCLTSKRSCVGGGGAKIREDQASKQGCSSPLKVDQSGKKNIAERQSTSAKPAPSDRPVEKPIRIKPLHVVVEPESTPTQLMTVLSNFEKTDTNHDGFLGGTELREASRQGDRVPPGERKALAAVEKALPVLEEASDDEMWDENDGVTPADLTMYNAQLLAVDTAGRNFFEIDKDSDGIMTKAELSNFVAKHPEESDAIDTLLRTYDEGKEFGTEDSFFENSFGGDFFIGLTHCRVPDLFGDAAVLPDAAFPQFMKDSYSQFNMMDEDGDGFVSPEESNGSSHPRINHIFQSSNAQLSDLHDDGESGARGVTRMDLRVLEVDSAKQALFDFFDMVDIDKNGYLSKPELARMLKDDGLNENARHFLDYVYENFEDFSGSKDNPMISREQLYTGRNYDAIGKLFNKIKNEYTPPPC